jgi:8-oxo-dGTP pyrophosphatase MutT (NUDIX family)
MNAPGNSDHKQVLLHPRRNDHGQAVLIRRPSTPTALEAWTDPTQTASVVPNGVLPGAINGVVLEPWNDPPTSPEGWEALARESKVAEPEFKVPDGLEPAAGAVIVEPDGRVWMVCPTNQFGGYEVTFPKGRLDGKSLQEAALVEAFEESGLKVRLVRHLVDVPRSQTFTRYYLAERVGGRPSEMGWETQCVMLVPRAKLSALIHHAPDQIVVTSLAEALSPAQTR